MDRKVAKINKGFRGEIVIPADKSISHRAVMLASLANGQSVIKNFSQGLDPLTTMVIFQKLGVQCFHNNSDLIINSNGQLVKNKSALNCNNSGTTMRLLTGILSGQKFDSVLVGDESLSNRPMNRIIEPLSLMGAKILSNDGKAPLKISQSELFGINYISKIASAQVKSSVILAGFFADGQTSFVEPYLTRNHTELMLSYMNANIKIEDNKTMIEKSPLEPREFNIPGDISSATYFIVAGLLVPNSKIILKNVGLNPTRTGILDVISLMGGNVEILDKRVVSNEIVGDLKIQSSQLHGCEISGELIPRLIDELPIIAVLATQAQGITTIKDAQDLRNKESDRISSVVTELKKLGADIDETKDGMIIYGKTKLRGGQELQTYNDHRLAMSWYVASLISEKENLIKNFDWVNISFPNFEELFNNLFT